ncbi:MAG: hypothetical protein Fur006_32800 [Coleofasciculaceae cyanobacterium]
MVQIRRKQALEAQQRRRRWVVVGVVAVLIGAIATTIVYIQHQQQIYSGSIPILQEDKRKGTLFAINARE